VVKLNGCDRKDGKPNFNPFVNQDVESNNQVSAEKGNMTFQEKRKLEERDMMPGKGCKFKESTTGKGVTTEEKGINDNVKRTLARNKRFLCELQSKGTLNEGEKRIEADCKWRIEALESNLEDDMTRMKSCAKAEENPEVKQNPMTTKVKGKPWDDVGGW
jgi:hypothetical protein